MPKPSKQTSHFKKNVQAKRPPAKKQSTKGKAPCGQQAKRRARSSQSMSDSEDPSEDGQHRRQRKRSKVSGDSDIEEVEESVTRNTDSEIEDDGPNDAQAHSDSEV
jgi:hypothetical protein